MWTGLSFRETLLKSVYARSMKLIHRGSGHNLRSSVMLRKVAVVLLILGCLSSSNAVLGQSDAAGTALQEGRRLLKRGHSDQALVELQKALSLYTAAKSNHGIAATENELR